MNELKRGAEILTKELNRIGDMVLLRDALEKVGGLQQAADEATARVEGIKGQEKAAKAKLDKVLADITATQEQAEAYSSGIVEAAKEKAKKIEDAASTNANRALTAAQAKVTAAQTKAKEIDDAISAKQVELRDVIAEIAAAKRSLDAVNADLARLRQRIA